MAMTVIKTNQDGVASITHDLDTTDLATLRLLSAHEIEAYVDADMPLDCAEGSFKIEALGITLFSEVKPLIRAHYRVFL